MTPRRHRPLVLAAAGLALAIGPAGAQASVGAGELTVSLVPGAAWLRAGDTVPIAVRLQVADGWYVYWRHAGEVGLPTRVTWALPPGFAALPLRWPGPSVAVAAGMTSHVLRGDIVLLGAVAVPADARGRITLGATVRYGVCRDVCIPGTAELSLALPVRGSVAPPAPAWRALSEAAAEQLERALPGVTIEARLDAGRACLVARGAPDGVAALRADTLHFFPDTPRPYGAAVGAALREASGLLALPLPSARSPLAVGDRLRGVLRGAGAAVPVDVVLASGDCP